MKKFFSILAIASVALFASSCNNDENGDPVGPVDPRERYIGTWNYLMVGSLQFIYDGEVVDRESLNETGTVVISKSGTQNLLIFGDVYTVNGDRVTATIPFSDTGDGFSMVGTETISGTLTPSLIAMTSTITGSWSGGGMAGNLSGTATVTLTR